MLLISYLLIPVNITWALQQQLRRDNSNPGSVLHTILEMCDSRMYHGRFLQRVEFSYRRVDGLTKTDATTLKYWCWGCLEERDRERRRRRVGGEDYVNTVVPASISGVDWHILVNLGSFL